MTQRIQKTIHMNEYLFGKIEQYKHNKKISSFSDAMNDLFLELIKSAEEQEEVKKIETKNAENIDVIKDSIKSIVNCCIPDDHMVAY